MKHCLRADLALREVEAETAAYLVANRTGLTPRSESYLDRYQGAFDQLDLHRIIPDFPDGAAFS